MQNRKPFTREELIIHVPHSSLYIPEEYRRTALLVRHLTKRTNVAKYELEGGQEILRLYAAFFILKS